MQTQINYYELVSLRKNLSKDYYPCEKQRIDRQIKKTEWLFMRTMFRLQECFSEVNFEQDVNLITQIMSLFLLHPNPEKFKTINEVLNQPDLISMQKKLLDFYTKSTYFEPQFFLFFLYKLYKNYNKSFSVCVKLSPYLQKFFNAGNFEDTNLSENEKKILTDFYETYHQYLKKQIEKINYKKNYFPQTTQGGDFFTNQIGIFFMDHTRNYGFLYTFEYKITEQIKTEAYEISQASKNKKIDGKLEINSFDSMNFSSHDKLDFIQVWLYERERFETEKTDKTYSLFDYCCLNWDEITDTEKFRHVFNTTTYLESRYITCHFDGNFFKSEFEPAVQTRNFYMKIWRGSSKLLQNLMRFHLNSDSKIYIKAQEKFRSLEFQKYVLEHLEQTNDLLFAFIFLPIDFATKENYEQLIELTKKSKYYSSVMKIDKLIPGFYIENIEDNLFSPLINLFSQIDPIKKINNIDKILFNNLLLVELSLGYNTEYENKLKSIAQINLHLENIHYLSLHKKIMIIDASTQLKIQYNVFLDNKELLNQLKRTNDTEKLIAIYLLLKKIAPKNFNLYSLKNEHIDILYNYNLLYHANYELFSSKLDDCLKNFSKNPTTNTLQKFIEEEKSKMKLKLKRKKNILAMQPISILITENLCEKTDIPKNLLENLNELNFDEREKLANSLRIHNDKLSDLIYGICKTMNLPEYNTKKLIKFLDDFSKSQNQIKFSESQNQIWKKLRITAFTFLALAIVTAIATVCVMIPPIAIFIVGITIISVACALAATIIGSVTAAGIVKYQSLKSKGYKPLASPTKALIKTPTENETPPLAPEKNLSQQAQK